MKELNKRETSTIVCIVVGVTILMLVVLEAVSSGAEYTAKTENGAEWDAFAAEDAKYNAEERVIDLPKDGKKWYISVIGDPNGFQYKSILRRFDRNAKLKALKTQVHFWTVPSNGSAFKERYKKNTKELPTIRVQRHDGEVIWEASKKGIPLTAEGLYAAIKNSSLKAMALLPWRRNGTVLPWRNQMERKCQPKTEPDQTPVLVDPQPCPIDDGGPPEFEEEGPANWVAVLSAIASALAGGGYGLFGQWKKITGSE